MSLVQSPYRYRITGLAGVVAVAMRFVGWVLGGPAIGLMVVLVAITGALAMTGPGTVPHAIRNLVVMRLARRPIDGPFVDTLVAPGDNPDGTGAAWRHAIAPAISITG